MSLSIVPDGVSSMMRFATVLMNSWSWLAKRILPLNATKLLLKALDTFQVQVVGWSIKNQTVGILQLHTGNHTSHLFTTGEYVYFLQYFLTAEEHSAQVALHGYLIILEPYWLNQSTKVLIAFKELCIVEWEIGCCDGNTPLVFTCISLSVAIDDFKESGHRFWIMREEYYLFALFDIEVYVIEKYSSVLVACASNASTSRI